MSKTKVQMSYDLSSSSEGDQEELLSEGEELEHSEDDMETVQSRLAQTGSKGKEGEEETGRTSGLADVMAKILRKQVPAHKSVILSKALSDKQLHVKRKMKERSGKEETISAKKSRESDSSDDDYDPTLSKEQMMKKRAWEEMGRVKVDITKRDYEKKLQRIATRGVVQLFNAVRKQQKEIEDKLIDVGGSERKKDKVMKSLSKGAFLDMLKTTPNVKDNPDEEQTKVVRKKPVVAENRESDSDDEEKEANPSWKILRDDFMMGAKMKDWDKDDEEGDMNPNEDDSSGSEG